MDVRKIVYIFEKENTELEVLCFDRQAPNQKGKHNKMCFPFSYFSSFTMS